MDFRKNGGESVRMDKKCVKLDEGIRGYKGYDCCIALSPYPFPQSYIISQFFAVLCYIPFPNYKPTHLFAPK